MAFKAPTLIKTLGTSGFKAKIETNFEDIEDALVAVQNELPLVTSGSQVSNLAAIERMVRESGVFGTDSFVPQFTPDDTVKINHDIPGGKSACVIGGRYHETDEDFEPALSEVLPAIDGDYVLNLGARTLGSPLMKLLLEVDATDNDQDLTFWQFEVNRASSIFTVTNLRRIAKVLISRASWIQAFEFEHPLSYQYKGSLPKNGGPLETGIIIPWDCEITGGWARLRIPPVAHTEQVEVSVDFLVGDGTDALPIFAEAAEWGPDDGGVVRQLVQFSQPQQLAAGTYVFPEVVMSEVETTDFEAQAADLTAVILLRRIYHEIR